MTSILISKKCKNFKKDDKANRASVCTQLKRLLSKIEATGCSNINDIINNESVTYDRISNQFFVYKGHGLNNTQLRLVYAYDGANLYLVDYINKKVNTKTYLSEFAEKYRHARLEDMDFYEIACV